MVNHIVITLILTCGIVLLGGFWVITAPKRTNLLEWRIIWRVCTWIFSIGLSVISAFNFPIPSHETDNVIISLGIVLYILGICLSVWAKLTMASYWGIPAQHNIQYQNKLFTTGPFAITRNPIYTGLLLVFVGYSLAIKSWFIFIAVIYYFNILKAAKKEEALLEKHFGSEYVRYKSQVPRFLGYIQ